MTKPTWAIVVGIIGIILGSLGIIGSGQMILMPEIVNFQKEMIDKIEDHIQEPPRADSNKLHHDDISHLFKEMFDIPHWFFSWTVVGGIIGMIIYGFYLFASIELLQVKPKAVKLFYCAIVLSIFFSIAKISAAAVGMSIIGFAMAFGGLFGIVFNIVLLIVVAKGHKEAFTCNGKTGLHTHNS